MKKLLSLKLWALFAYSVWGLAVPLARGADVANKKEILQKARQAGYSLKGRGLLEFQAAVTPNWRPVLKDLLASNPAQAEEALKLLNGIHFLVSMDPDGVVKVTHQADVAAPNAKAAEGFSQIYAGMEQAMTGFFDTWKPFMLTAALPDPESVYTLEETPTGYLLTYSEGTTGVATTLSKELVITECKVNSPAFKSTVKPQFAKSSQGFLLTGYDATYDGASAGDHVVLTVQIENQETAGQQLPRKLTLSGVYQGSPFFMELAFSDYRVKNR